MLNNRGRAAPVARGPMLPLFIFVVAVVTVCVAVSPAGASQLIGRDALHVKMEIDAQNEALITFTSDGKAQHILAGGAVNALPPNVDQDNQVKLWTDYSGGWGKYGTGFQFVGTCKPYTGPTLSDFVAACDGPDGSYWALQQWQRMLPDYGVAPNADQAALELHLSHWTGPLPVLTITTDWVYAGRFDHLFGSFTYRGTGVYGFKSTPQGVPLDSWGRNIYVDAYDSAIGKGIWARDNSFLTHKPDGTFCYGFFPHAGHPAAKGTMYRATIEGPGVTPDITWQGKAPGTYDKAADAIANTAEFAFNDPQCKVK